jgi:hypothetical protein
MTEENGRLDEPSPNYGDMDLPLKLSCEELQKAMLEACLVMETEALFKNASPDFRNGFIAGLHRQRWLTDEENDIHNEIFGEGMSKV